MNSIVTYKRRWSCECAFAFITAILLQINLTAQSPYRLSWGKDLAFTGAGMATLGTSEYLRKRITLFTPDELERLDRGYVSNLDRHATHLLFKPADHMSDIVMSTSHLMPVIFLAGKKTRRHFDQIVIMYGETMLINAGLTMVTKFAVHRPRPFVFNGESRLSSIQSENAQASFVSGHTSSTAAATFFMAKVYSDFHPDSKWRPVVWTAAAIVPAVTGYLRVRAGKHYPTDVIGGYALGAAVGFLVPHLHRDRGQRNISLSAAPNGFYFSMNF